MRGGCLEQDESLASCISKKHNLPLADIMIDLVHTSTTETDSWPLEREKLGKWCQAQEPSPTFVTIISV